MLKYIKFTRYSYVHHSWMKWKCNVSQANTRSLITINDSSFSLYMIIIIIKVPSFDDISHFPYTTNLIYNTDDFLKKKIILPTQKFLSIESTIQRTNEFISLNQYFQLNLRSSLKPEFLKRAMRMCTRIPFSCREELLPWWIKLGGGGKMEEGGRLVAWRNSRATVGEKKGGDEARVRH